jgi:hypothetical protein
MDIMPAINDEDGIVKHYWQDILRKEWVISKESLEGKAGAPLNPQEWIEHYYRIEGAVDYFEETINSRE